MNKANICTTTSMCKPKGLLPDYHVLSREESIAFRIDLQPSSPRLRDRSAIECDVDACEMK